MLAVLFEIVQPVIVGLLSRQRIPPPLLLAVLPEIVQSVIVGLLL